MKRTWTPDDPELEARVRAGDRAAFDLLAGRHRRSLAETARRVIGDHHLAQDLVQEALLRAFQRIRQLDPDTPFVAWVLRIVRNVAVDRLRRRRRRCEAMLLETDELDVEACVRETPPTADTPFEASIEELSAEVWTALCGLGEVERRLLLLRYGRGFDLRAIAEECGSTVERVKVRLHRGRMRLWSRLRLSSQRP